MAVVNTGDRYGRLTVVKEVNNRTSKHKKFQCLCDCGEKKVVFGSNLRRGYTTSCGCLNQERKIKHGMSRSPEYNSWRGIVQRCTNKKAFNYRWYGAIGVQICDQWRASFEAFLQDIGPRPGPGFTVDRINVEGHYEPGNCRWATAEEQSGNKRGSNSNVNFDDDGPGWEPPSQYF